ncbi:HD-GYP domain-containing protein [Imbroritus primus]|uniref:HD-GYP domain-containing protein n=1 Tax=Imbroritus primus TaxID=3058603 RepID=UPI003D1611B1
MPGLRRLPVEQLAPGMRVEKLDVPWSRHPFVHARFTVESPQDAINLRNSGVRMVWIADTEESPPPSASPVQRSLGEEISYADRMRTHTVRAVRSFYDGARVGHLQLDEELPAVMDNVAQSLARNSTAMLTLVRLRSKDEYTYLHSVAVGTLMTSFAQRLGLSPVEVRDAGVGGMLHDIGKMAVPLEILNKPGALTPEEYAVAQIHPDRGYTMLRQHGLTEAALDIAHHHHEKMNGLGYPLGLKGDEIPLLARMAAICDVYDALTAERPYKKPWPPPVALGRMSEWDGHFDPKLLRVFIDMVGIYPAGTLVRLDSGYLAIVLDQNEHALLRPIVSVIYDTATEERVTPRRLNLLHAQERIVACEEPERIGMHDIVPLWRELASD